MSVERAPAPHFEPEVALIVALGVERDCFGPHLRRPPVLVSLRQCGPGAANAGRAAAAAIDSGAKALVSWGMAGALAPGAATGSFVLPRAVVGAGRAPLETSSAWRSRLAAVLRPRFAVSEGNLLAASQVLCTPAARAGAAAKFGAVAVDMESGAVAAAAAAADVPFVVIRVIADGADDTLPHDIEQWVDRTGRRRVAPVVNAALRPDCWPSLLTLARRYRNARRAMNSAARELTSRGFLFRETNAADA